MLAVFEDVGEGWDAAVWVDGEEPWLFLGVFRELDFVDFVGEAFGGLVCGSWGLGIGVWCLPEFF